MDHQHALNRSLQTIGPFSQEQLALIGGHCTFREIKKHDILLEAGQVCSAFFFLITGACYQFRTTDAGENIIDLHVAGDCVVNHASFVSRQPATETIKAYEDGEIGELTIQSLHQLIARSQAFLQLAKLLQVSTLRTDFFDDAMTPAEKYQYILANKPGLIRTFPLKYIASYLKITPETLSRVRAAM